MSKKFIFNKEDLKFSEIKTNSTKILLTFSKYLLVSVFIAMLFFVIFSLFFDTKKEKRIKAENEYLVKTISEMESKSELVDGVIENLKIRDREIYREIFNADPPVAFSDDDNDSTYSLDYLDKRTEAEILNNVSERLGAAISTADEVRKEIDCIGRILRDSTGISGSIPCIIPLKNFTIAKTGASVGMKINPFYKTLLMHNGVDLISPVGTDVLAAADGVVVGVERTKKGKGNFVTIEHSGGIVTVYAHLGDIFVRKGQRVKQRALIARTGNSGTVFAPSLHYEVLKDGKPMDPIDFFFADISPAVYKEMMIVSRNTGQSMD